MAPQTWLRSMPSSCMSSSERRVQMSNLSDKDLLKLGKKVHKLFSDDRYETSVYGVGWETGRVLDLKHYACHMGLMKQGLWNGKNKQVSLDRNGEGPVVISNQVQSSFNDDGKGLNKKEREKFFSFLFTDSVFAGCYISKDPSRCEEDGITVRTNLPANLVVAACIATRQAWEYPEVGRTVIRLIKFGVEPRKAHIAAHVISVRSNGEYVSNNRGGHIAVYANRMGKKAVSNFLSGTLCKNVKLNLSNYREARDYREIPTMWGPWERECNSFCIDETQNKIVNSSDPFRFIKHAGKIKKIDVVEAVEQAFEGILR